MPFGRKEVLKFISPKPIKGEKHLELLIPSEKDLLDYIQIVTTALRAISLYEDRSIDDIISQILVPSDLFKFHIATIGTSAGNIPLKEGLPLYENIFDLFVFSACAELFPEKKVFPRRLKVANDFAESCQIAPSNYGSYVANILCPIPSKESQGVAIDEYPPLERRSVIRILRGFKDVAEAVRAKTPDPIVQNHKQGLNANMCEALTRIIEVAKGNELHIQANLSLSWSIPDDVIMDISLDPSSRDYLEAASNIFGEEIANDYNKPLTGLVLNLTRNPNEEEKMRTIRFVTSIEGIGVKTVTVHLDESSYREAIDAHKDLKFIKIRGNLEKINNRWYLINPEKIEVIEDFDPSKVRINKNLEHIRERTMKRRIEPNIEKRIDSY